jgi:hypothetical protein
LSFFIKVSWIKGVAVLITTAIIVGALVLTLFIAGAEIPLLQTPEWQGREPEYGEQIMLRRETASAGALLLKHSKRDTPYQYEIRSRTLVPISEQDWQGATGPVAECGKQFAPAPQVLDIDRASNKLVSPEGSLPTTGRIPLRLTKSPSGKKVAVLSADGNLGSSVVPFSGGSGASGQHYLQIMSLPKVVALGQPSHIPHKRDYDSLIPCWSADEQFVVIYSSLFNYLSIVETQLNSEP